MADIRLIPLDHVTYILQTGISRQTGLCISESIGEPLNDRKYINVPHSVTLGYKLCTVHYHMYIEINVIHIIIISIITFIRIGLHFMSKYYNLF